jgi:hypothetical protein
MTTKNWGMPRSGWFLDTWPDIFGGQLSNRGFQALVQSLTAAM